MSRSRTTPVELDFFRMEKENSSKSKLLQPNRSFKGIQGAISKLNPELLKSVINSGSVVVVSERKTFENNIGIIMKQESTPASSGSKEVLDEENPFSFSVQPSTPKENLPIFFNPIPRCSSENPPPPPPPPPPPGTPTAPLTIFYNGTVSVFDVPCNKAEKLMKLAENENSKALELNNPKLEICSSSSSCDDGNRLLEKLNGDFPIQRKKSLQMFLQKRKARLTFNSPYANSPPMMEKSKESVQA